MTEPAGDEPNLQRLTLMESARILGHFRWIEMRLFELLGQWVTVVPEADVKLVLGMQSHHHAWHAELWRDRMPILADIDPEALTRPVDDELVDVVDGLSEPGGADRTIEKLVGVYRVLVPRLLASYQHYLARCHEVAEAPVMRSLGFVLLDVERDRQQGEALLRSLIASDENDRRAI